MFTQAIEAHFCDGSFGINYNVTEPTTPVAMIELPLRESISCEPRDFVYSEKQDLVGVIMAVDDKHGMITVYIGSEIAYYYAVGTKYVRSLWNKETKTFCWETVSILRDE